jgi:hypothetical protein
MAQSFVPAPQSGSGQTDKWKKLPWGGNDGPSMIQAYQAEAAQDPGSAMVVGVNGSYQLLKGFWLDRKMIDTIFAQDDIGSCNGIRIYFGKKQEAVPREYTLVFVGTESAEGKSENTGAYFDYVDPCPTNCGTGG